MRQIGYEACSIALILLQQLTYFTNSLKKISVIKVCLDNLLVWLRLGFLLTMFLKHHLYFTRIYTAFNHHCQTSPAFRDVIYVWIFCKKKRKIVNFDSLSWFHKKISNLILKITYVLSTNERKVFFRLSGHLVQGRHLEEKKKHIIFVAVFLLYIYMDISTLVPFI